VGKVAAVKSREIFLRAPKRQEVPRPAVGSATSVVTIDLMDATGIAFPEAHLDAAKMAGLAAAGHTLIGFDNVMPLFSVWHESAAMGCPTAVVGYTTSRMRARFRKIS